MSSVKASQVSNSQWENAIKAWLLESSDAYIFHVVLHAILLQVGGRLCPVESLSGIQVRLLKVVPVDLQFVLRVGAQVH